MPTILTGGYMSIECLNLALKAQGLTPTKKFILVLLGNYADENGKCYPSYRHIAEIVGLKDTKGVQRAIKEFEQDGLLSIERRVNDKGGYTSNMYQLTIPTGKRTPTPVGLETPTLTVQEPPNTKDNKKEIYTEEFEKFWAIYPRKISKFSSAKSFAAARKDASFKKLMVATVSFAEHNKSTEERFIPHAQTWLNQKRFEDIVIINKNSANSLAG
jgi:hypothetical protein|tara:strand:- start:7388 stop:8032 length:645 start_codon:yes stop_codon:yes gene_type:complete